MKPEIKIKWLEALRSGQYLQGKNTLHMDGRYCCLGVLCDIAASEGIGTWNKDMFESAENEYDRGSSLPPSCVLIWAGILDEAEGRTATKAAVKISLPPNPEGFTPATLAEANDHGYSFSLIADIIEEQL